MIRPFKSSDMEPVLQVWLESSTQSHDFVEKDFWISKVADMRDIYLPASETYVYDNDGEIYGFMSLYKETLAAIFVLPGEQGKGIGKQLLNQAKVLRERLNLTVYKENKKGIAFYEKYGFKIAREQVDEHTGHLEFVMIWNA